MDEQSGRYPAKQGRSAAPLGLSPEDGSQAKPAATNAARFYIDCEFDGHGGEMLSMALVREDGRGIYLCVADQPDLLDPWVEANVWPLVHLRLPVGRTVAFVEDWGPLLRAFIGERSPTIVADSPVDIWRFCEAVSTDADGSWWPTGFSRMTFEVHNVDCYPTDLLGAVQHNAWWDAQALRHRLRDRDGGSAGDPERGSTAKQRQPGPCKDTASPNLHPKDHNHG